MPAEYSYKTIGASSEGIYKDSGSKFIADAIPLKNAGDLKSLMEIVKKKHPKAHHHCYAMRLSPDKTVFKSSDDGEPAGTAGKPILNAILSNELTDILIVVSRYFGGTLLGVPGLIKAYKLAAMNAIANSQIIIKSISETYQIEFDYSALNEIMPVLKSRAVTVINQNFNEICIVRFEVAKSEEDILITNLHGNYKLADKFKINKIKL